MKLTRTRSIFAVIVIALMIVMTAAPVLPAYAGEPEPQGAAVIGETSYDTLAAALEAAKDGDTITVTKNIEIDSPVVIDKNVTLDFSKKVVTVTYGPAGGSGTASAFRIPGNHSVTFKNAYITTSGRPDTRGIEAEPGSTVTVDHSMMYYFRISGVGGCIYAKDATLNVIDSYLGYYDSSYNIYDNSASAGGAIFAEGSNVNINKTTLWMNFSDSSRDGAGTFKELEYSGGAVHVRDCTTKVSGSSFWYDKSDFSGNISEKTPWTHHGGGELYAFCGTVELLNNYFGQGISGHYGGSVYLDEVKSATVTGNKVTGSTAVSGGGIAGRFVESATYSGNSIYENSSNDYGGGMYLAGGHSDRITLAGNTVEDNKAGERGGAVTFRISENADVDIQSGTFTGNSAGGFGGAIDYTGHDMPALRLRNVLITGNTASRGAGVWGCPTSEVETHSTLGGDIFGNRASDEVSLGISAGKIGASGDDVRYEGADTEDTFTLQSNPASASSKMYVSERASDGSLMSWFSDEKDSRWAEGQKPADRKIYQGADGSGAKSSFGLHGEAADSVKSAAQAKYSIVITGNSAGRGGAIASNSPVEIGESDSDVNVKVTKTWSGKDHPDSLKVDLYRVGDDGSKVKLDSDVVLNEDNDWSAEFKDLPSKYADGSGVTRSCRYTVEEQTPEGWTGKTETSYDESSRTYEIKIANTKGEPEEPPKEEEPEPDPEPERTSVTITKKWNDGSDSAGNRPDPSTFAEWLTLYRVDGDSKTEVTGKSAKITDNGDDTYTVRFEGLDKYEADGSAIEYMVEEVIPEDALYTSADPSATDGGTITNDAGVENRDEDPEPHVDSEDGKHVDPPTPSETKVMAVKKTTVPEKFSAMSDVPRTGDNGRISLYCTLLAVSAAALIVFAARRIRKE